MLLNEGIRYTWTGDGRLVSEYGIGGANKIKTVKFSWTRAIVGIGGSVMERVAKIGLCRE